MTDFTNNLIKELKTTRPTYAKMIDFCCDSLILNNEIISFYNKTNCDMELVNGADYDEIEEEYKEFFQFYLITGSDAERLQDYTDEVVYYLPQIDLYVLAVSHWGTPWSGVSANWK